MRVLSFILACFISSLSAQPLSFSLTSSSYNYSITCANPTVVVTASSNFSGTVSYIWSGGSFTSTIAAVSVSISSPGSYSVLATAGTLTATQNFVVNTNTTIPLSTGSPSFLVTSTSPQVFTFTAISPTTNITHYIYSPLGGTFTSSSATVIYPAGSYGVYRYCMVNDVNGCSTACLSATVPSSPGNYNGIIENGFAEFYVFPNPSYGLFTLVSKPGEISRLEVLNSVGKLLYTKQVGTVERTTIDIQDKCSGIYLIKIVSETGVVHVLKILKE